VANKLQQHCSEKLEYHTLVTYL